ncbi:uncharacterized protein LOC135401269 [Ornithodoros turicata]|uniref:uncharacterized protein LOC135401269 n=1 Tax=Ornithodoros turicata TaxID=34597 RepID=UPI003138736D
MDLAVLCVLCSLLVAVRAECETQKAIEQTDACGSAFKSHLQEKPFNRSDPEDHKQACCSLEELQECLESATMESGCQEEVAPFVEGLAETARDLIGNVYSIPCNYTCSAGTNTLFHSSCRVMWIFSTALVFMLGASRT